MSLHTCSCVQGVVQKGWKGASSNSVFVSCDKHKAYFAQNLLTHPELFGTKCAMSHAQGGDATEIHRAARQHMAYAV